MSCSGGSGSSPSAASIWSWRLVPERTCSRREAWLSATSAGLFFLLKLPRGLQVDQEVAHDLAIHLVQGEDEPVDLDLHRARVSQLLEKDALLRFELQRFALHPELGQAVLAVEERLHPAVLGEVQSHLERGLGLFGRRRRRSRLRGGRRRWRRHGRGRLLGLGL